jgi:hypothetical protein
MKYLLQIVVSEAQSYVKTMTGSGEGQGRKGTKEQLNINRSE